MKSLKMSNRTRKNTNKSQVDEAWTCVTCRKNYGDPLDQVLECDNCAFLECIFLKHFCAKCLKMPTAVFDYMSKSKGIWCCDNCTEDVKNLMKDAVTPKTHQHISKMRTDLDKTVDSVKILLEDFYYFMNGTKNKAQPTMGLNANPWKREPDVTKPLKDILLEAGAEQKREEEEDLRRKRNLIIHKAPESKSTEPKLRQNEDMSLIRELCASIEEIAPTRVKNCTRLGKLSEDHKNETRPRPLRITLETQDDAEHVMKNLTKLKYAKDELKTPENHSRQEHEREGKCPLPSAASKKLNSRGIRQLHSHCQREQNNQSKEKGDSNDAKNNAGNREHFELWFGNV